MIKGTALVLALAVSVPAFADEVVLKNGAVFSGVVREDGDRVIVEVDFGSMTFKRADVRTIRKGDDPIKEFELKVKAATDAKGYYELALWARDRGLATRANDLLRKVLALDPEHEGARKALGYEKVDGQWLEGDELMVAKGFVKQQGRWLKKETAEKFEQGEKLLQIEVERLQTTERIARLQAGVERARLAVEREKIDLERERGVGWDPERWWSPRWGCLSLWPARAVDPGMGCRGIVRPVPCPDPAGCSSCGSSPCKCGGSQPRAAVRELPPLPTRLPPPPPLPAPITGRP